MEEHTIALIDFQFFNINRLFKWFYITLTNKIALHLWKFIILVEFHDVTLTEFC